MGGGVRLRHLSLYQFRRLREVALAPHPRLNLLVGDNGAGKTSLLEAIAVLGRGRSPRSDSAKLATAGEAGWRVAAELERASNRPVDRLAVTWKDRTTIPTLNDQPVGVVDLVRTLPVVLLDPSSHRIAEDGPGERRRVLDWGVFHVEPDYGAAWALYARLLRQRNAALRDGLPDRELEPWTAELAVAGESVHALRLRYLDRLRPYLEALSERLLDGVCANVELRGGWDRELTLAAALEQGRASDRQQQHTRSGPHRAEVVLFGDNQRIKDRVSRGEQKLLLAALQLAQARLHSECAGAWPLVLVDDFAAELSERSQFRLADELAAYPGQVFATFLQQPMTIQERLGAHTLFHVEQGAISRMDE